MSNKPINEAVREQTLVPQRIVLWSRGVSPNWYFAAHKADRPDIEGAPVYETMDEIVLRGSPEARGVVDEEMANRFVDALPALYAHNAPPISAVMIGLVAALAPKHQEPSS